MTSNRYPVRVVVWVLLAFAGIAIVVAYYVNLQEKQDRNRQYENAVFYYKNGEFSRGLKEFRILAASGYDRALINIAWAYEHGKGVERSRLVARAYAERRVEKYKEFYYNVGTLYAEGYVDGPNSQKNAIVWYTAAAELGHPLAIQILVIAHREGQYGLIADAERTKYWSQRLKEME